MKVMANHEIIPSGVLFFISLGQSHTTPYGKIWQLYGGRHAISINVSTRDQSANLPKANCCDSIV
jgi:hypothetical protein